MSANINELLKKMDECFQMGIPIPKELDENVKDKIDGYFEYLSMLKSESKRLTEIMDMVRKKRDAINNQHDGLREFLFFNMKAFGWEELKGKMFNAQIIRSKRFSIKRDPTDFDVISLGEFIEPTTSYKWKKDLVKESFNKAPDEWASVAEIKESEDLRIS